MSKTAKAADTAEGSDTNQKRTIGDHWERSSDGKGLFVIAEQMVDGKDVRQQLLEKTCGHPIASLPPKRIPKEPS